MHLGVDLISRTAKRVRRIPDLDLTTADLDYQDVPYQEVAAKDLIDFNVSEAAELLNLGLEQNSVDRVLENRPHRSKLELISRMVVSESEYAAIRDRVAVAEQPRAAENRAVVRVIFSALLRIGFRFAPV